MYRGKLVYLKTFAYVDYLPICAVYISSLPPKLEILSEGLIL